jgi:hypothetical protein
MITPLQEEDGHPLFLFCTPVYYEGKTPDQGFNAAAGRFWAALDHEFRGPIDPMEQYRHQWVG